MKCIKSTLQIVQYSLLTLLVGAVTTSYGQNVTLELPVTTVPSITVTQGAEVTFSAGTGCTTDYLVQNMSVATDQMSYSMSPFNHTFSDLGTFSIQCDCPTGLGAVCTSAYNVTVIAASEPIPTLGEWGLIVAFLLLAGVGLVALRSSITSRSAKA